MNKKHLIPFMSLLMCLASCDSGINETVQYIENGGKHPNEVPTDPVEYAKYKDSLYTDSIMKLCNVTMLQQHTAGEGFHVVIMADGYTKEEISKGKYREAVLAARNALFQQMPMSMLKQYVDVIEVVVPSLHSGVDYTKRNTGLRTSLERGNGTGVYGDSVTIENCAAKALVQVYSITKQEELDRRINNTLVLTLLNTNVYKGVTLLAANGNIKDGIPSGYSISYVPAYATITSNGRGNVFADLVMHEGVGHGIAKLGDEYYYLDRTVPSNAVESFREGQRLGLYQNISYSDGTGDDVDGHHPIESSSWLYPFTQMPEYAGENLQWYKGAFEYAKGFYRCTNNSIMNSTGDPANNTFNVASRAMIYKRIMRVAYGENWKFDYNVFRDFDAKVEPAVLKSVKAAAVLPTVFKGPELPAPKIIKRGEVRIR